MPNPLLAQCSQFAYSRSRLVAAFDGASGGINRQQLCVAENTNIVAVDRQELSV